MKVKVIMEPQPEGGFTAYSAAFPGCVSEGETEEEATENFLDALEAWLEVKNEASSSTGANRLLVEVTACWQDFRVRYRGGRLWMPLFTQVLNSSASRRKAISFWPAVKPFFQYPITGV